MPLRYSLFFSEFNLAFVWTFFIRIRNGEQIHLKKIIPVLGHERKEVIVVRNDGF